MKTFRHKIRLPMIDTGYLLDNEISKDIKFQVEAHLQPFGIDSVLDSVLNTIYSHIFDKVWEL